jgi:hypothetical protein
MLYSFHTNSVIKKKLKKKKRHHIPEDNNINLPVLLVKFNLNFILHGAYVHQYTTSLHLIENLWNYSLSCTSNSLLQNVSDIDYHSK